MELAIWQVPATDQYPQGVRYRLAFVLGGAGEPALLYDNHQPKGHHRHTEGIEQPYDFTDVDALLSDFVSDVRRITGDETWPKR